MNEIENIQSNQKQNLNLILNPGTLQDFKYLEAEKLEKSEKSVQPNLNIHINTEENILDELENDAENEQEFKDNEGQKVKKSNGSRN